VEQIKLRQPEILVWEGVEIRLANSFGVSLGQVKGGFLTMSGKRLIEPSTWNRLRLVLTREIAIVAVIFVWACLWRLPFFFPAAVDWDESGFIIMGQGILDGLLPYDALWEMKPPLVYAFFAAAIGIFGKTIVAVRFAGCLWITIAAYLTYRSAYVITLETKVSLAAAALLVAATSVLAPSVMAECLALVPLVGALLLLLTADRTPLMCLLVGILLGTAAMFRTNLAYLAVFVGLFIVIYPPISSIPRLFARAAAYVVGGIAVVITTALPYLVQGRLGLWLDNVFMFPLLYSQTRRSIGNAFGLVQAAFWDPFSNLQVPQSLLCFLLWVGGSLGVFFYFYRRQELPSTVRYQLAAVLVFLIGSTFSVFMTGPAYTHYLVQLAPWFAIFSAWALSSQTNKTTRFIYDAVAGVVLLIATLLVLPNEYSNLQERLLNHKSVYTGREYAIANYLQQENPENRPVFLLSDIIVYWLIGQYPPTRLANHPSNLAKAYMVAAVEGTNATPASEMARILSRRPSFIIKTKKLWYLRKYSPELVGLLDKALEEDYFLAKVIEGAQIYRLK